MEQLKCRYIPVGDCSAAWNLQRLGLRVESYVSDWCRCKIIDYIYALETKFQFLCMKEYLTIEKIDYGFFPELNTIDSNMDNLLDQSKPSKIKIINTKYNFLYPHEPNYDTDEEILDQFIKKYSRRVDRLLQLLDDKSIKKIFVIVSPIYDLSINQKIIDIGSNIHIKDIVYDKKQKYLDWKKEELYKF
jgi:hypothetical protein